MGEATPWLRLMARSRFAPAEFWRLSLREWRALAAPPKEHALSRAALIDLAQRFPDVIR